MKKKLLSFLMAVAIALTSVFPSSVLSSFAAEKANVDLTLNTVKNTIKSGNSAVFQLDLKVAGSQESINEEIGEDSILTIQLPIESSDYYELDNSDLSIDGIRPL